MLHPLAGENKKEDCEAVTWTDDAKSTTGNKKGLPELSQPQEPTYLTSTTTETSGPDA